MPNPQFDLDLRLRLAALDAVRRLTETSGGVLTREQMSDGFEFEGTRVPFANLYKGIWKPALTGPSAGALSLTTAAIKKGVKPKYDDQVGSDDEWFEYRYQGEDPSAGDNRAVRAAFIAKRPLIYFYGIIPGVYVANFPAYIMADEPERLTFKIAIDSSSIGDPRLLLGGAEAPLKAYATVMAKRRLHQRRFRELVVSAYGERCTICQIRHSVLLDAAHILEDHDQRGMPEVPNGLALCKIHHSAYDANIMGIDPDRRIHIREDILDEVDGPMLRHGLQEMNGLSIHVPSRAELKPRREYLGERFERFRAA